MQLGREESFKDELQKLLDRHKVKLRSYDNYDGDDHYSGTDYIFEGKGIYVYINELEEVKTYENPS